MTPVTFIDLFCGCGGFSLGLRNAGWRELAAIDFDASAIETFKRNAKNVNHVLVRDLTRFPPSELDALLSDSKEAERPRVDVIVGGPPCQGFSRARRVDGANHGKSVVRDPRRYLYREFLAYVAYFQPAAFIMENVLGIKTAAGGRFLLDVQDKARQLGYRVNAETVATWEYGVPQKRVRQLIIGTRRELPVFSLTRFSPPEHRTAPQTTLWNAIGDLPRLEAGKGTNLCDRDRRKLDQALRSKSGGWYLREVAQIDPAQPLSNHVARRHSQRDLRDFARLKEGESSAVAMRERRVKFEWPYSKDHFKDRYTRQHRNRLCSTIVAHLSKDGLMFIHPTQLRSLTPREVARVQSFPDWFRFPEAQTHAFRLIGNAFPPLAARAVGAAMETYLREARRLQELKPTDLLPSSAQEAIDLMLPLVSAAANGTLQQIQSDRFKRGWMATAFLCFKLHPDSATTEGKRMFKPSPFLTHLGNLAPQLSKPTFVQGGWPTALAPIALEARRRLREGFLSPVDYYCAEAHMAGATTLRELEVL